MYSPRSKKKEGPAIFGGKQLKGRVEGKARYPRGGGGLDEGMPLEHGERERNAIHKGASLMSRTTASRHGPDCQPPRKGPRGEKKRASLVGRRLPLKGACASYPEATRWEGQSESPGLLTRKTHVV